MRLLIIEDDKLLCEALSLQLKAHSYDVDICLTGEDALFYALQNSYDIIILDRMLPGIDGLTILQAIRKNNIYTPVIMATAMNQIHDKIDGLDAGADDYIVKPFDIQELMARIRALSRRPQQLNHEETLSCGDLSLNISRHELSTSSCSLSLSRKETALFEYLIRNKNQVLTRTILLAHIWGPDAEIEEGNLDNYIHFARKRLKTLKSAVHIQTIHGTGYRMEDTNASQ